MQNISSKEWVNFSWFFMISKRLRAHFVAQDYLAKEESTAGAHGVETRYPFLDRNLVQEFLWLSSDARLKVWQVFLISFKISRYVASLLKVESVGCWFEVIQNPYFRNLQVKMVNGESKDPGWTATNNAVMMLLVLRRIRERYVFCWLGEFEACPVLQRCCPQ